MPLVTTARSHPARSWSMHAGDVAGRDVDDDVAGRG